MKILQLISGDLGQGGGERLMIDLSEAQANLGNDVTICSFRQPSQATLDTLPKNVKFYTFGKSAGLTPLLPFKIAYYIRKEKFDVVNCHLTAVFLYIMWAMLVCKDTKFFYTIHNNPIDEEPRKWVRMLRTFFIKGQYITFVGISDMVGSRFNTLYGQYNPIPVIYNGRKILHPTTNFDNVREEVNSYRKDSATCVFIAVGRLMKQKNYDLMIDSFRTLLDKNVQLVVLGRDSDGFLASHQADLPANVHFLGGKSNVYDYLLCADCFIMSSLYEGLPISILEAYSAGLPVISTPVGGIPDVVKDGINGYLSDSSLSVDGFVETIERYLQSDEDAVELMRQNNKNLFAAQFDITTTAKQYIALYAN